MKLKIMFTPPICYSVASALFMAFATLRLSMLSAFAFGIANCLRVNNLEMVEKYVFIINQSLYIY